jgi:DNA-binding NtrC family response regulator
VPALLPRLLLIEDDHSLRGIMREILARGGFEVETASRAAEAVNLLATHRYAAIVSDCRLPDLLPLDWLAALRGAAPTTPLILVSGLIGPSDAQRLALECRAFAVLEKPFPAEQLVTAVKRAIEVQGVADRDSLV